MGKFLRMYLVEIFDFLNFLMIFLVGEMSATSELQVPVPASFPNTIPPLIDWKEI